MDYETEERSLVVDGLLPHTTYECIVAARTRVGAGPFSGIVTVQTFEEGEHLEIFELFHFHLPQLQVVFLVIPVEHLSILPTSFSRGTHHHSVRLTAIFRNTGSQLSNMKQTM